MERCIYWMLWAVISVASTLASAVELGQVRIAAESWPQHTDANGDGLAWDILRAVYEPAGVELQIHSVPYTRSIGLVQRGAADAWVGAYLNEIADRVIYPRWHYDADKIVALGLASTPAPTLESIGSFRLAWVHGYEYQRYLPNLHQYREVLRRSGILGMLDQGRTDFYLDAQDEITFILRDARVPSRYRVSPLIDLPLYLGFGDNPRGRALAELFDKRMDELVADGRLRPIFMRWKQPYPFD